MIPEDSAWQHSFCLLINSGNISLQIRNPVLHLFVPFFSTPYFYNLSFYFTHLSLSCFSFGNPSSITILFKNHMLHAFCLSFLSNTNSNSNSNRILFLFLQFLPLTQTFMALPPYFLGLLLRLPSISRSGGGVNADHCLLLGGSS